MPCSFEVRRDLGLVVTRFHGRISDEDFVGLYTALLASGSGFEPGLGEVADLRAAQFAVSPAALRRVNDMTRAWMGGARGRYRTVIIAPDDIAYGLSRLYGGISQPGPEEVQVFRSLPAAAEALDMAPDALEDALRWGA